VWTGRSRRALAAALLVAASASVASADAAAPLFAGFAVEPLPAPGGGPLAGYGGWRDRRAEGMLDPPEARALVLERGELRVALVALDVLIARPDLVERVRAGTSDLALDALALVATHTHSGPGGYVDGWLAGRVTGGSFDAEAGPRLAAAATRAVRRAADALAPARASAALGSLAMATNRSAPGGPRERALPVLHVEWRDARPPLAVFAYGAHATALPPASRIYSADWVGAARAWLEARGKRALFLPGPLGDQAPSSEHGPLWPEDQALQRAQVAEIGARVGDAVFGAIAGAEASDDTLRVVERRARPPALRARRFCALWWLAPVTGGALEAFASDDARLQAVRLGDARLVLLPAEPASALGQSIRERAGGGGPLFVVAHANDWLGYAVTPEAWESGSYESCLSLHGPEWGPWLVDEALATLRALDEPAVARGPKP
jgi:hypothetical protein